MFTSSKIQNQCFRNHSSIEKKESSDIQLLMPVLKSRRMRWAGHIARMGEKRNAYRILVGKPEEKRPLGRPRRRWVDNVKMDLRHRMGWYELD
jgi:hypothetical protein